MSRFGSETEQRVAADSGAVKGSKLARFDLIPVDALWQLAELYGRGAAKYEDRNWERGLPWSLNYAAMLRHANQFWGGEDVDEETQACHMASVAWHALALLHYYIHPDQYGRYDDRPSTTSK